MQRLTSLLLLTTAATIPTVTPAPTPIPTPTCGDEGDLQPYGSVCGLPEVDYIRKICTDSSIQAFNKHNTTFGIHEGSNVLVSCMGVKNLEEKKKCQDDMESFTAFRKTVNVSELTAFRKEREQKILAWDDAFVDQLQKMAAVIGGITPEEETIINELYVNLLQMKKLYTSSRSVDEKKKGNCGEQTDASVVKLLRHSQQYGLSLKIQKFAAKNSKSAGPIVDHEFPVLNGDSSDINIVNDKKKVAKYLKSIKTGMICDTWNKGLFVLFTEDKTNLYNQKAGWDNLTVQTVASFNFGKLNKLPLPFKKFFCKELSDMGLSVEPTDTCGMFTPKEDSSKKNKPKKKKQAKKLVHS